MTEIPRSDQPAMVARRRISPREVAETTATILITSGVVMMMQPFFLVLYTWSFVVTLAGTVLFVVGSKFPK